MLKHLPSFSVVVSFGYIIFSLCSGDGYSLAVLAYWGRRHFLHFESQIARSRLISPAERLIRLALLRLTYIPLRPTSSSIVTLLQPGPQNIAFLSLPKKSSIFDDSPLSQDGVVVALRPPTPLPCESSSWFGRWWRVCLEE